MLGKELHLIFKEQAAISVLMLTLLYVFSHPPPPPPPPGLDQPGFNLSNESRDKYDGMLCYFTALTLFSVIPGVILPFFFASLPQAVLS